MQRRVAALMRVSLVAGLIALIGVAGFLFRQIGNENQVGSRRGTPQLEMKGTKNREAWNAYMKGHYYFERRTREGVKQGIEFMKEAIRLDPNFAQGYAGLAQFYHWGDYLFRSEQEAMTKAKEAAQQALALDDSLAQAHSVLGYVEAHLERDFSNAEREYKRATELSPNYGRGHAYYGWFLMEMGRVEEAKKEIKLAQWFEPVSPSLCCIASYAFFYAGQFDEAAEQLHQALKLDPNYALALEQLVEVHEERGEFPEAIETLQKGNIADGVEPAKAAQISEQLHRAISKAGAQGYWQKRLELANQEPNLGGDLYNLAVIYVHLDEKDSVFECLEKIEARRLDYALRVNCDRRFDSLRSHPRFVALLRKLKLEK